MPYKHLVVLSSSCSRICSVLLPLGNPLPPNGVKEGQHEKSIIGSDSREVDCREKVLVYQLEGPDWSSCLRVILFTVERDQASASSEERSSYRYSGKPDGSLNVNQTDHKNRQEFKNHLGFGQSWETLVLAKWREALGNHRSLDCVLLITSPFGLAMVLLWKRSPEARSKKRYCVYSTNLVIRSVIFAFDLLILHNWSLAVGRLVQNRFRHTLVLVELGLGKSGA
ncbi:hypothetical protein Tco_0802037 [Tanacetum coccineum]|uniref:Uncharacterized protein n=1 Tax=Tanacetum coccineum TaxID=301880 RepID=A0ABQ4ZXN5_9ASTR